MADIAAGARASGAAVQVALTTIHALSLTAWRYPPDCGLINGSTVDYIVVGAGTAGSVITNRLISSGKYSVATFEAGSYPQLETEYPSLFPLTVNSNYDFNISSSNDGYTMQNMRGESASLVQGKCLGGCSTNGHMLYHRGDRDDFQKWAEVTNDPFWDVKNLMPYYLKQEKMIDSNILSSEKAQYFGTDGLLKIGRNKRPEADQVLNALGELGNPIVDAFTSLEPALGFTQPIYTIADGVRQNHALAYLGPIKNNTNLCMSLSSTVTKILFENNVAKGVQVTKGGSTYVIYARKEVIVSAGVINTPKLLMLSGIGPKANLESLGINVIADLPVGQSYMEQAAVPILIQTEENTVPSPAANPHEFPVPAVVGNKALDSSTNGSVYQAIILGFGPNSTVFLNLCSLMFRFKDEGCQALYQGTINRNSWIHILGLTLPNSNGNVSLTSSDPNANPIVNNGVYTNPADLDLMTRAFSEHVKILETSYYKSINATVFDLGSCSGTINDPEFVRCYVVGMSSIIWHNGGTCPIGKVLDNRMRVKGIPNLRVADSSSMPALTKGGVVATVGMLGELVSDWILNDK